MNSFSVVSQFEQRVADFAGSSYAVAVNTGTSALFLSLKYCSRTQRQKVTIPARTFVSVPMAVLQAGLELELKDYEWSGTYQLSPYPIWDAALRFHKGMYQGGLVCLSFHARKLLNIGEGGMILTDDKEAADWLRAARYSGRKGPGFKVEDIADIGWQLYMTPEKAARGLHLMDYVADDLKDQSIEYPDLRKAPVFNQPSGDYESGEKYGLPASCRIHRLANICGELKAGANCRIDAFVTITGKVTIGHSCHIATGAAIFGGAGVTIGDGCSLSPGAKIFTATDDVSVPMLANPQLETDYAASGPVSIGNYSVVGSNCVVLPNTTIEDEVQIGCLSLVKGVFDKQKVYGGIPARFIKAREPVKYTGKEIA